MSRTWPSSTAEEILASDEELLNEIKKKGWWQGSVIPANALDFIQDGQEDIQYWVISSQACNIYNEYFDKVPVFEVVGAQPVDSLNSAFLKGDNPRILHVAAQTSMGLLNLSLDIQRRRWVSRKMLATISNPVAAVCDPALTDKDETRWLDNLAGWMGRSYTRVALPDAFNQIFDISRIKEAFDRFLKEHHKELHGIYLIIGSDSEWEGRLGEMPPPYNLGMVLTIEEAGDPEKIRGAFVQRIFSDKIKDPLDEKEKITRSALARRHQLRLSEIDVEARSVTDITLSDLRSMVRYSLVDHFSDSTLAA